MNPYCVYFGIVKETTFLLVGSDGQKMAISEKSISDWSQRIMSFSLLGTCDKSFTFLILDKISMSSEDWWKRNLPLKQQP